MSCGCGSSNQKVTTDTNIPAYLQNAAKDLVGRATATSQTPYQPYPGPRLAGFSPDQTNAFDLTRNASGAYGPDIANAEYQTGIGAAPLAGTVGTFDQSQLSRYGNPYNQGVIDSAVAELQRQGQIQGNQLDAKAAMSGAFGGDRAAIEKSENTRNLNTTIGNTVAGLKNQNFAQAQGQFNLENQLGLQARQSDAARAIAAGQQYAGLGDMMQRLGLTGANALYGTGAAQQQQQQQGLNIPYQDFLTQQQYPYNQENFLTGILSGNPHNLSQTQISPTGNTLGGILGTGVGILGMTGAFPSGSGAGSSGWLFGSNGIFARGGIVGMPRRSPAFHFPRVSGRAVTARARPTWRGIAPPPPVSSAAGLAKTPSSLGIGARSRNPVIRSLPPFARGGIVGYAPGGFVTPNQSPLNYPDIDVPTLQAIVAANGDPRAAADLQAHGVAPAISAPALRPLPALNSGIMAMHDPGAYPGAFAMTPTEAANHAGVAGIAPSSRLPARISHGSTAPDTPISDQSGIVGGPPASYPDQAGDAYGSLSPDDALNTGIAAGTNQQSPYGSTDWNSMAAAAGFGMAASPSPNIWRAIGQGGLAAVQQRQQQRQLQATYALRQAEIERQQRRDDMYLQLGLGKNQNATDRNDIEAQRAQTAASLAASTAALKAVQAAHVGATDDKGRYSHERGTGPDGNGNQIDGTWVYDSENVNPPQFLPGVTSSKGNANGSTSVFQQKQTAWLAVHPDDKQGALDYASGTKKPSYQDARKIADNELSAEWHSGSAMPDDLEAARKKRIQEIQTGDTPIAAAPKAAMPTSRPAGLPAGSLYSPSRQQWRDPSGTLYDLNGNPVQ